MTYHQPTDQPGNPGGYTIKGTVYAAKGDAKAARELFEKDYADVFAGDERWRSLPTPEGNTFEWDDASTYVRKGPYFDGMPAEPAPVQDVSGARVLLKLGDSVTTDHISPAGNIKADSPAGVYLSSHGIERRDFNSYGSRRGNHEVMIRGTFANIRLRNQIAPGTEGGFTRDFTVEGGPVTTVYDASANYQERGIPLVVLSGKEYGSGSSRDWAAKGTSLLGVKAVITESFERIHRSNLIGMGVIPLQFPAGESAKSLGLDGTETFDITGIEALNVAESSAEVRSVVITGAAGVFCSGGNLLRLQASRQADPQVQAQSIENLHSWIEAIRTFPKPVIAAVEGAAFGAGAETGPGQLGHVQHHVGVVLRGLGIEGDLALRHGAEAAEVLADHEQRALAVLDGLLRLGELGGGGCRQRGGHGGCTGIGQQRCTVALGIQVLGNQQRLG